MKPSTGTVTRPPITAPRPSVEASRNRERGIALRRRLGRRRRHAGVGRGCRVGRALGRHLGRVRELRAGGQVAHPEEAEGERDQRAEPGDLPRDDQADEQDDHADGEADRPETRARNMGVFVVRLQRGSGEIQAVWARLVNVVTGGANSDGFRRSMPGEPYLIPYSSHRRSTRACTSPDISISGGHSRVPSSGPFAVASMPILPAEELQRRRVVEMVERALGDHDVALRDRRWRRRRTSPARSRARRRARRRPRSPSSG